MIMTTTILCGACWLQPHSIAILEHQKFAYSDDHLGTRVSTLSSIDAFAYEEPW